MAMMISDKDRYTLVNALYIAKEQYAKDAAHCRNEGGPEAKRLAETFDAQVEQCDKLIAKLEE